MTPKTMANEHNDKSATKNAPTACDCPSVILAPYNKMCYGIL